MNNSVQKGQIRIVSFKKGKLWYAVALEFNIVETGKTFPEVMQSLHEAIEGYIIAVKKAHIRPFPLNQIPLKEFAEIWKIEPGTKKTKIPSPFYKGTINLAAYA